MQVPDEAGTKRRHCRGGGRLLRSHMRQSALSAKTSRRRHSPIQDLREWLTHVDDLGELVRVDRPVSRDEEMSAVSYLVAKQQPSPAVLFERPSGFENSPIGARLLWNILGPSFKRVALTLEQPVDTPKVELIRHTKGQAQTAHPPARSSRSAGACLRQQRDGRERRPR
jgi:3-polyprenyl-4-hydroxybenzoate decarboxylase